MIYVIVNPKGGIKEKMKNIKRNKKALSPVVASIILVAVTVAVSIAVAAWMGALTVGFMDTEQIEIRDMDFTGSPGDALAVTARNTGTSAVIIRELWINQVDESSSTTVATVALPTTIAANGEAVFDVTYLWTPGNNYQIKLVTAKGNPFLENAIPPT